MLISVSVQNPSFMMKGMSYRYKYPIFMYLETKNRYL